MTSFSAQQRETQSRWREESETLSQSGRTHGQYRGKTYPFLLQSEVWQENLYPSIRELAPAYFEDRSIVWHRMRHHLLSSQVCCLNFLMPYAGNKGALERLLSRVFGEEVEALPVQGDEGLPTQDAGESYIGFEWIGGDHLGETSKSGRRTRGANCTSADAVVRIRRQGRVEVWLIEWKYTESYGPPLPAAGNPTRRSRYERLAFAPDGPIRSDLGLTLEDFFFEPFYQLLRQQMLAWRMQKAKEQGSERVGVLHLAPRANLAFQKVTSKALNPYGRTVTEIWPKLLVDPTLFRSCALEDLFGTGGEAVDLLHHSYLLERYSFLSPDQVEAG
ncbi:PGN_0703 family putative restriction endonuclease [Rubellimicrobium arenae]|uniref:PGN_0703 family putative restriction endonuclease n=1 Tax=Rubellimicrobium arenae TaxID=2817372 RepID=UPI001B31672B|nr:hypothetical protein [Rubellimicrobium arenae]